VVPLLPLPAGVLLVKYYTGHLEVWTMSSVDAKIREEENPPLKNSSSFQNQSVQRQMRSLAEILELVDQPYAKLPQVYHAVLVPTVLLVLMLR